MKKLFWITAAFMASIVIIWIFGAIAPGSKSILTRFEKINIDCSQTINVALPKADIKGWNKDYVGVQSNNLLYV